MLLHDPQFDAFFKRTVTAVTPYADSLVCIGGCANALYRHHPLAAKPWPTYLGTMDADWAVPQRLSVPANGKPISALMEEAGFVADMLGVAKKPVVKFRPQEPGLSAEIEFLCPLSGVKGGRGARTLVSTEVQPGLYAQPLRYIELLLCRPWRVEMGGIAGFEELAGRYVLVPNPAAYVVQKVLIRSQGRSLTSIQKDCYYIYEVSVLFRRALERLHAEYRVIAAESAACSNWMAKFRASAQRLFDAETSEGPASAVRVHEDSAQKPTGSVTPRMVHLSVRKLLEALS
jgi:hypothetical protein